MPQLALFKRRWRVASGMKIVPETLPGLYMTFSASKLIHIQRVHSLFADTVPILAIFLAVFHIAITIPLITITVMTESESYHCRQKTLVQAALFGPLIIYLLCIVNEFAIFFIGIQGGPLEERKRRFMRPFVYLEVALWFVIIILTIWATFVAYDPSVGTLCWSDNPCATIRDLIPSSCTIDNNGDVKLTSSCKLITSDPSNQYGNQCLPDWSNYAATWMLHHYNESRYNSFNPPYPNEPITCNKSVSSDGYWFKEWYSQHVPNNNIRNNGKKDRAIAAVEGQALSQLGIPHTQEFPSLDAPWIICFDDNCKKLLAAGDNCTDWQEILGTPNFATDRKAAFLAATYASWGIILITSVVVFLAFNTFPEYGESESWEHMVRSISRLFCCSNVLENAETATGESASKEIGRLLHILFGGIDLDPTDQFLGMFLVAERQRWRRQRHVLKALKAAGINRLPPKLGWFGKMKAFLRKLLAFRVRIKFINSRKAKTKKRDDVILSNTLDDRSITPAHSNLSDISQLQPIEEGDERRSSERHENEEQKQWPAGLAVDSEVAMSRLSTNSRDTDDAVGDTAAPLAPHPFQDDGGQIEEEEEEEEEEKAATLLTSPFECTDDKKNNHTNTPDCERGIPQPTTTAANRNSAISSSKKKDMEEISKKKTSWQRRFIHGSSRSKGKDVSDVYRPPKIAHSFVRLMSIPSWSSSNQGSDHKTISTQTSASGVEMANVPRDGLDPSVFYGGDVTSLSNTTLGKELVLDDKPRPLLTPFALKNIKLHPNISSYDAAKIYNGQTEAPVEKKELESALEYSKLARAAYGLQTVRWNGAVPDDGCGRALDNLLACCTPLSTALRMKDHFKKRNFQAILDITQCNVEDLLYVSYASAAFGALPYMILLHKQSRSVVLSIRGTVGFEDLITDLLSNPVDATESLPEWVVREATEEELAKGTGEKPNLYAHEGIRSSTKAVLKDLEEHGLLRSMQEAYYHSESSRVLQGDPTEGKVEKALRLTRDKTMVMLDQMQSMDSEGEIQLDLDRARSVLNAAIVGSRWRFVVAGHSLGAAVACMVSFHLYEDFPTLQCYAYCPPGGLLSDPLSRIARRFCTSVVVGYDPISRLGLPTTRRVVDEMVLALARCKRPKLVIMYDFLTGKRNDPESVPPTFCAFKDIGEEARAALQNYLSTSRLHSVGLDTRELYPPGRIIYLRPFTVPVSRRKKMVKEVWDAVWVSAQDVIDEGILLTLSMTRHHRLTTLEGALESAIHDEAAKSSILNTIPTPIPSADGLTEYEEPVVDAV